MSTILKALRRLEEDTSTSETNTDGALPATDPGAADELRGRLLAEESVARAAAAAHGDPDQRRRTIRLATVAVLIFGLGIGTYSLTAGNGSDRFGSVAPATPATAAIATTVPTVSAAPPVAAAATTPAAVPDASAATAYAVPAVPSVAAVLAVAPKITPPSLESEALVEDEPAGTAANEIPAESVSVQSLSGTPAPTRSAPAPTIAVGSDSVRDGSTSASPSGPRDPTSDQPDISEDPPTVAARQLQPQLQSQPDPISGTPEPEPSLSPFEPKEVKRHDRLELPDLTIIRTAWHPIAERRTVKIRLEKSNELLTLREGDAVGGLVVKKISPSSVLFDAGDVEIRHRIGPQRSVD